MPFVFNPFTGKLDSTNPTAAALNVLGTVADFASLPGGATTGDVYQTVDTGDFYVWDGAAWDNLGDFAGPTGATGATGATGPAGADGADGEGVPAGGTADQYLTKIDGTDYNTQWSTLGVVTTTTDGLAPATAFSALTYSATTDLDMSALDGQYKTITLTGDLTLTSSNRANGRSATIRLLPGASTRTLTFPAGWVFLNTKPSDIAANKTGVLSVTFFGTADTDCVASYAVQA